MPVIQQQAIRASALALIATFGVWAGPRDSRCSNASLKGEFAFTASGTTLAALGLPGPLTGAFASSGTAEFDGKGRFSLTATSSFNGVLQGPSIITGTYSVNADCSYTSKAANGVTFFAAIVADGQELLILQTTTGVVITGGARIRGNLPPGQNVRATGARPLRCGSSDLAGSYGFIAKGSAGAPTIPGQAIAPLAGAGVFTLHVDGSFRMMAQRSVNGTIDPQPLALTGAWALGPNCTFRMNFDVGFHFDATVVTADEIQFVETDPGTALLVNAKRI
jgi:hypothetical protein